MNHPNHFLGLKLLSRDQIEEILDRASFYRTSLDNSNKITKSCIGKNVINLFFENSTRTRVSFELAEKIIGMNAVNFSNDGSSFSKGESLLDTIKNLNAMKFDCYVVRHSVPGIPKLISQNVEGNVINAGDGAAEHPTQGLLDIMSLNRYFKCIKGLRICIVGDISHSRVAMSNIFGLRTLGAKVSVCGPRSFIPKNIEALGVEVYDDIDQAIKEHDAINVLRVQLERDAGSLLPSLQEYSKFYGITMKRISLNPKIKILHPGPMNINVEIDYESSVSRNSLIFDQVTNGLSIRLAIFDLLSSNKNLK
ncbi:MAG: aspartate carbamoyltransferase catalytic subunit [Ignavibacteria bacterium]|nr:aspartate carbamoyltransferase catalytic subunit [Ignavibacteria bacterium]